MKDFSLTAAIRGLCARGRQVVDGRTVESDIQHTKALDALQIPGSYLVEAELQSKSIQILGRGGALRRAGATVIPFDGVQKASLPIETDVPAAAILEENDEIDASDPAYSNIQFSLHELRCLTQMGKRLLQASRPSIDLRLANVIGAAIARLEDSVMFGSIDDDRFAGSPLSYLSGTNVMEIAGGSIAFSDLCGLIEASSNAEVNNNLALFMTPSTFWNKVMKMTDGEQRPLFGLSDKLVSNSTGFAGAASIGGGDVPHVLGLPVYLSTRIPDAPSSPAKSQIFCMDPGCVQIADGGMRISVGLEQFANLNIAQIMGTRYFDFAVAPAAGISILLC